jgi:hypothetical protein
MKFKKCFGENAQYSLSKLIHYIGNIMSVFLIKILKCDKIVSEIIFCSANIMCTI